jgi:hypothetical protein
MTGKEICEKSKGRMTLLEHGREIGTETASGLCAGPSAKTAGDFLLNLDHANVTFHEVIVERDSKVIDKGKDLATSQVEAFGKIASFGFLDTTAFAFGPAIGRRGCGGEGLLDKLLIAVVNGLVRSREGAGWYCLVLWPGQPVL